MEFTMEKLSAATASLVVVLAVVSLTGGAVAGADLAVSDGAVANESESTTDVEIDRALQDAEGEVEVIVRFEPVDRATVQASENAVETLKTKASASQGPLHRFAARTDGVTVENEFWITNAALVTVDTERVPLAAIGRIDGVDQVHENFEVEVQSESVHSDTVVGISGSDATSDSNDYTYGLEQVNAPQVWDEYGTKGSGVKVAVLDTGVDPDHPDIDLYTTDSSDPTYPGGWAEFDGYGDRISGSTPYDSGDHGTHVTGTVSGADNSGKWIGVAPETNVMHGLVLSGGSGSFAQISAGMEWAVTNDADVISMSLGAEGYYSQLIDPVRNAQAAGSLVVAAAGNDGEGTSGTPGNIYDSFAIGASDANENIASFSSGETVDTDVDWGSDAPSDWPAEYIVPDVAAPGVSIKSSVPGGGYDTKPGTSMATPHVSGVVSLMESATDRDLTPAEITTALEETARKPADAPDSQDTRYGHGIVDAFAATQSVASGSVTGTVTDNATGEVIDGATVTIEGVDDDWRATTQTDASGTYEFRDVPAVRDYTVTVTATGYEQSAVQTTPVQQGSVTEDLALDGNATLSGTLVDATEQSNAAVATTSADVTVTFADGSAFSTSTTTDADGNFALSKVAGDSTVDLTIDVSGYRTATNESIAVPDDGAVDLDSIPITGDANLSLTVEDRYSNAPVDGAAVELRNDSLGTYAGTGDGTGGYNLSNVSSGYEYTLVVDAAGYRANETRLTELTELTGGDNDVGAVQVDGDGVVEGTIIDAASAGTSAGSTAPVSGANVTVTYPDGVTETKPNRTDGDGWFRVDGIPGDGSDYTVNVTATGYVPLEEPITVRESETVDFDRELAGDAAINASVTAALTGDALANASVTVTGPDGDLVIGPTGANESGHVHVPNVPGTGSEYNVSIEAPGYEAISETVTVDSGSTPSVDVALQGGAAIDGTVVDTVTDRGIENASVTVSIPDREIEIDANVTSESGAFTLEHVPGTGASYAVNASAPGYENVSQTVSVEGTEHSIGGLSMAGNASIAGTVNTTTGERIENVSVAAAAKGGTYRTTTAGDGTYHLAQIPGTGVSYEVAFGHRVFENESRTESVSTDVVDYNVTLTQHAYYFGVENVSAPETVTVGDTVEIAATVSNLGTADWNQSVRLLANETEVSSKNVSLNATDTWRTANRTTVAFSHTPEAAGAVTYDVVANETASATVTVEESGGGGLPLPPPPESEPSLSVVDATLATDEIEAGGVATVVVTVANTGDADGSRTLTLELDGDAVATTDVSVPAGEKTKTTLEHGIDEPGEYDLAVDGESAGRVTVVDPESSGAESAGAASDEGASGEASAETDPENATDGSDGGGDDPGADSPDAPGDDGIPGFSPVAALVALMAFCVIIAHTRRRDD
ncbi:carboxypeptidase regulatory-like domain-containing protein [Halovivax limisalsi]|uniref:carboxypeptidase regulatory-like domain-containing protein n=1 Tax=Halovivax limisalsi TaxID=1453760 RepID=UPI001FFC44D0|nr:carboxypeptidase regulatory-like domain-containing protein [Halovivax limisalsi]